MDRPSYTDLPVAERMKLIRDAILSTPQGGDTDDLPSARASAEQIDRLIDQLANTLANARSMATVHEQPFTSGTPVLGPFIVMVRNAWNWMSTKWWVRPMLMQQNGLNAELINALCNSLQVVRLTTLSLNRLTALTAKQQVEIRQLRYEVTDLQARMTSAEPANPLRAPE
jgi:hypothetical protein